MAWEPRVAVWLWPLQPPLVNPSDPASFGVVLPERFPTREEALAAAEFHAQEWSNAGGRNPATGLIYPEHRVARTQGQAVQV